MIIATVKTCPRRWSAYRALLRNFNGIRMPMPLRTFQTPESGYNPAVNSRLNARAALAYCERHLPEGPEHWALFLEDDVVLRRELCESLDWLVQRGAEDAVDCWYLCNSINPVKRQFREDRFVINELAPQVHGSYALFIPKRHLKTMLCGNWAGPADFAMFRAINGPNARILQIVSPVLAEHRGEYSTFNPHQRKQLEVNHANSSDSHPAAV